MKDENYEEMRKQICAECGDVLPFPCSDSYACIMADEIKDRSSNGAYGEHASLVKAYDAEIARLRAEAEENKVVLDLCGNTERHLRDKAAGLFMEGEKKDGQIAALTAQLDQAKVLLEDTSCGQRHIGAESCPHCDGLIDELIEAISND